MANNLAISITADVADLTAKMAVAQVAVKDYGKTMRDVAREVAAGDTSDVTKAKLLEVSDAYSKASSQVAIYKREMASAKGPQDQATASVGQMKAGMQSLSYQINDVATMFALGAPPMQIFASQGSQVIQSLQMMNGGAKGLLGVLGGPWGTAMIVAATALTPFISKLIETGNEADKAKEKVYGLRDALADMRTKPMEVLGKLQGDVFNAEGALRNAKAMPRYTGGGSEEYKRNTYVERARTKAIQDAEGELEDARRRLNIAKSVEKTNQSLFEITAKAGRSRARSIKDDDDATGGGSKRKGRGTGAKSKSDREAEAEAKKAAREQADAARDALQERLEVTRQQESIAEGAAQTEIELSRLVLESKLADIEAEQRNGQISDAQALQRKAVFYAQMDQLDIEHENRVYAARLKQLKDEQANYAVKTQEYRSYLRRIEELEAQHKNRLAVLNAQADNRRRQQERVLTTESNRRMVGMAGTWAQNLARMATLQQGFSATVKGLWQGLVGLATDVIAQIVEQWIIGELIKIGLMKVTNTTTIAGEAAKAGAGGTASMAAAPFPLNLTAPAFGASMYGAAMAYQGMAAFAKGTNELPNDMVAQIHAGERIVPKADNDTLIELTKRGAMMGAMGPGAPKSGMQGGGSEGVHVHLHGTVIHGTRDLKKFAEANAAQLSAAGRKYVRNNGRG